MILLAFWLFQEILCQPDSVVQTMWQNIANVHGTSTADWSTSLSHIDGILTNRIQVLRLFVSHNSYLEHYSFAMLLCFFVCIFSMFCCYCFINVPDDNICKRLWFTRYPRCFIHWYRCYRSSSAVAVLQRTQPQQGSVVNTNYTGAPPGQALDGEGGTCTYIYTSSTWPFLAVDLGGRVMVERILLRLLYGVKFDRIGVDKYVVECSDLHLYSNCTRGLRLITHVVLVDNLLAKKRYCSSNVCCTAAYTISTRQRGQYKLHRGDTRPGCGWGGRDMHVHLHFRHLALPGSGPGRSGNGGEDPVEAVLWWVSSLREYVLINMLSDV